MFCIVIMPNKIHTVHILFRKLFFFDLCTSQKYVDGFLNLSDTAMLFFLPNPLFFFPLSFFYYIFHKLFCHSHGNVAACRHKNNNKHQHQPTRT